jgi:hypothetical protein
MRKRRGRKEQARIEEEIAAIRVRAAKKARVLAEGRSSFTED